MEHRKEFGLRGKSPESSVKPKDSALDFNTILEDCEKIRLKDLTMDSLLSRREEMLAFQESGEDRRELEGNEKEIIEYYRSIRG